MIYTHKSVSLDHQGLVENQPLDNLGTSRGGEAALVMVESGEVAEMSSLVANFALDHYNFGNTPKLANG